MNQKLKEQAHKEFEEKKLVTGAMWLVKMWEKNKNNTEIEIELPEHIKDEFRYFIDSLIDKTVQYERERIAKWVDKNTGPGGDTPYPELMCFIAEEKDFDVAIKSLITNKSDINK